MEQQESEHRPALSLTDPHAVGMIRLQVPLKYLHPNGIHGSCSCREGKGHSQGLKRGSNGSSVVGYFHSNE